MNINSTNTCLILTVDSKNCKNNLREIETNEFGSLRDYEEESILCVSAWRKNAGWLKDIPIYIHSPVNDIEESTVLEYQKYGIIYVDEKIEVKDSAYGFFNVHYSGSWMEENLPKEIQYTIHIDLDMELIREIPREVFEVDAKVLLGGYFKEDYKRQRQPRFFRNDEPIMANTGFIVADRDFKFYNVIIKEISELEFVGREYDIEEYAADSLVSKYSEINTINGYEQGEGYEIAGDISNVWFWHQHSNTKNKVKLGIEKFKLLKRIGDA